MNTAFIDRFLFNAFLALGLAVITLVWIGLM
jgi:hypothetical protein